MPAIPAADLARIAVPTALIWGRNDLATPLRVRDVAYGEMTWALLRGALYSAAFLATMV